LWLFKSKSTNNFSHKASNSSGSILSVQTISDILRLKVSSLARSGPTYKNQDELYSIKLTNEHYYIKKLTDEHYYINDEHYSISPKQYPINDEHYTVKLSDEPLKYK
jgi:hypothetical protein